MPAAPLSNGIFICYRRLDTPAHAGRLYDALSHHFGEQRLFMDVTGIQAGVDFRARIQDAISLSGVVLAVIGPRWLEQRLTKEGAADFIEFELAEAHRQGVQVVPVLVGGARMPDGASLPQSIERVASLQASVLSDDRWRAEVAELTRVVTSLLEARRKARAGEGRDDRGRIWIRLGSHAMTLRSALGAIAALLILSTLVIFQIVVGFGNLGCLRRALRSTDQPGIATSSFEILKTASEELSRPSAFMGDAEEDPWTISQRAMDASDAVARGAAEYLQKASVIAADGHFPKAGSSYRCWKFSKDAPCHIITSAWALLTLSRVRQGAPEVARFLAESQYHGAWCAYPCGGLDEAHSTYATSFALMALEAQLDLTDDAKLKEEIRGALEAGGDWLLAHRIPDTARWHMFPEQGKRQISVGDSGMAVHALHRIGMATSALDDLWLDGLNVEPPGATDIEEQSQYLLGLNGWIADNARRLPLPWTIIATTDAYRLGSILGRIRALRFFDKVTDHLEGFRGELAQNRLEFATIEFAIALKYVTGTLRAL
jgi:hypothetical protein